MSQTMRTVSAIHVVRHVRRVACGVFLTVALGRALPAQTVSGIVVNSSDAPVSGVLVLLLDSAATTVARTLSNERGEFRIVAPVPGRFRLRTLRIGLRPVTSAEFGMAAGEVLTRRITLTGVAFSLDTVKVSQRAVCRLAADSAATTFAVWEQVRGALTAATLTSSDRSIVSSVVAYTRIFDVGSRRVLRQSLATRTDSTTRMWSGVPVDTLHRSGYVVVGAGDSVTFRAPSLETLASELFAEDHCFRITSSRDSSRVGITFEPSANRRRVPEIAGTLWLDRNSSELRSAEFHYANVERLAGAASAGGSMDFMRMTNGAWVITRWSIRMPIMKGEGTLERDGRGVRVQNRTVLAALEEVGGELTLSARAHDTLWVHAPLAVTGTVSDSATALPVSGARLALLGTDVETIADTAGRFNLTGALPGDYILEVHTTSLDSLHAVQHIALTLATDAPPLRVRVSSAQQVASAFCRTTAVRPASGLSGIVIGTVDAVSDTLPQANVKVMAEWSEGASRDPKGLATKTDANGNFRLCGVPINTPVMVQASSNIGETAPIAVTIAPGGHFAVAALTLDPSRHATAAFTGVVVDSAGLPVPNVEIAFPTLGQSVLTSETGAFRLPEIPAGAQELRVRKIGWGPLDTILIFAARQTVNRHLVLSRVTVLNAVETRAEEVRMREFEENRRLGLGHFFTQADIERLRPVALDQLLATTPGLKVIHGLSHAYVVTSRGPTTLHGVQCGPNRLADVYIDNLRVYSAKSGEAPFDINLVNPATIAGIEFYAGGAQTPARYQNLNTTCGVLVIWTKR